MMKLRIFPVAVLLALTVCVRAGTVPREVLSFYYGWYANPTVSGRWGHWAQVDEQSRSIGCSAHYPLAGAYDSHNPKIIAAHCREAKQAGLTGLIATWWGRGEWCDQGLPALLEEAGKSGLSVTAYLETARPGHGEGRENALGDVLYLLETYGKHPAWMKVNGKPVLFLYARVIAELGLGDLAWVIREANRRHPGGAVFIGDSISRGSARVFDGIHTYNVTAQCAGKTPDEIRTWAAATFPQWVETAGPDRIACLTVIPGYDDEKLGRPGERPTTKRHDGATYRALWTEAIAANPDWVVITSWNEWHEGSEIEPSVENGDRELKSTAEFARRFLALPPRPARPRAGPFGGSEAAALSARLGKLNVAVLPGAGSDAFWSLLDLKGGVTHLSWADVVDSGKFSPASFPVTLYAAGEVYAATVKDSGDVPRALRRYVEEGGTLAVLPSGPLPFFYDSSSPGSNDRPQPVGHAATVGLPLAGGWERPPAGGLRFRVARPAALPHVPEQFDFPTQGDMRWRPVADEAGVTPLLVLQDAEGRSLGTACGQRTLGKGRILYCWFRLLDMPVGEPLSFDLWQLIAQEAPAAERR